MQCSTGAAPSFDPVVAGAFTQALGWRWIFWLLAIPTGAYFIIIVLLLPETQGKVVGNGSIKAQGLYRSLFDYFIRDRYGVYQRGDDILDFPIECARLTGHYSLVLLSSTSTIGYGISLMTRLVSSHIRRKVLQSDIR